MHIGVPTLTTAYPNDDIPVKCLSWINERLRLRAKYDVEREEKSALRRNVQARNWTYLAACLAGLTLAVLRLLEI